jgi:hypothetical protein
MGVITLALIVHGTLDADDFTIPLRRQPGRPAVVTSSRCLATLRHRCGTSSASDI